MEYLPFVVIGVSILCLAGVFAAVWAVREDRRLRRECAAIQREINGFSWPGRKDEV